jgi:hypothetical protein
MNSKDVVNIIVDLYEMRASTFLPLQAGKMERVHNIFQYNFFSMAIAQLCDKYKVEHEDIEEVIRERDIKEKLQSSI